MDKITLAKEKFGELIEKQLHRVLAMKEAGAPIDYAQLPTIVIGTIGGDGIGPSITAEAKRILEFLFKDEIASGKIIIKDIQGLTIENRLAQNKSIPDDVLEEIKSCNVLLKGPTATPDAANSDKNIESANVSMRRALDLFANVRPVKVEEQGIDWTFFRENTEGAYVVGSQGITIDEDLAIDFAVTTTQATERIIRAAFDFAKANGKTRVTAVTKANIIKTTDGKFLNLFYKIAKEYPSIDVDDWYIDIMTAKLLDVSRRKAFQVLVSPNLYGDILTDEAAELQGGVGTAGSANIGTQYAMFEAIHGSAPRMVTEGRAQYADPCSIIRAAAMLVSHIGYTEKADKLNEALTICTVTERKIKLTGREDGATTKELADYIMETINSL